jgi:hypothetical protein
MKTRIARFITGAIKSPPDVANQGVFFLREHEDENSILSSCMVLFTQSSLYFLGKGNGHFQKTSFQAMIIQMPIKGSCIYLIYVLGFFTDI